MSFAIYVVGYLILMAGLIYGAVLMHVPQRWIVVGANRRTAEMVGGGAVLGTIIGAIAGGGKGAAIGAAVGAAAGAGTEILTKGKEVRVPSETVLNFRLDQDLILRPVR